MGMRAGLLIATFLVSGGGCHTKDPPGGSAAFAQTLTKGYIKRDGAYVAPSLRSRPNSTKLDNYSSRGNVSPYSGKRGTADPFKLKPYRAPR